MPSGWSFKASKKSDTGWERDEDILGGGKKKKGGISFGERQRNGLELVGRSEN